MDLSKVDPNQTKIEPFLGLDHLAPFQLERTIDQVRVRIFWRRCFYWLLALLPLVWLSLATAAYLFVKHRRGFPDVQFNHMLFLPVKLDDYRRSKGEFFIAQGKELFQKEDYLAAFGLMRTGLVSVPEDTETRRLLGELYLAVRRPDLARPLLVEGLPYNTEQLDYLQWVFASLFRFQEDDAIVQIAADFLAAVPDASPNARHVVLMAQATAHVFRARYDAAEAVLRQHRTYETQDGQLLLARIAAERGQPDLALRRLSRLYASHPDNLDAYVELTSTLRRLDRHDEARRLAVVRQFAYPDQPRAFLDELQARHDGRDEAGFATAVEDYLARFTAQPAALDALASFASNAGRHELALRLYENRAALGLTPSTAAIALIESKLVAGRHREVLAAYQRVVNVDRSVPDASERGVDALRAIAFYAQGDILSAQGAFTEYVSQTNLRPDLLILTARRLAAVGARTLAVQALKRALYFDPLNHVAFQELVTIDLDAFLAEDLENSIKGLLALRQPPLALLHRLRADIHSDRYLFLPERTQIIRTLEAAGF